MGSCKGITCRFIDRRFGTSSHNVKHYSRPETNNIRSQEAEEHGLETIQKAENVDKLTNAIMIRRGRKQSLQRRHRSRGAAGAINTRRRCSSYIFGERHDYKRGRRNVSSPTWPINIDLDFDDTANARRRNQRNSSSARRTTSQQKT